MAEIILYKGKPISLGTEMNLWHVSYGKLYAAYQAGVLKQCSEANLTPEQYLKPNSVFRFRFTFPGEDKLKLGEEVDFRFRVPILTTNSAGRLDTIYISHQRCVLNEDTQTTFLTTMYRNEDGMKITELTDIQEARQLSREILKNHISGEKDLKKRAFYRNIITTMLKGYLLKMDLI